MSFEFQSTLVNVTPNFRIGGSQIGGARKEMIGSIPTLRLVIVDDADIRFALSGPFETGDPDVIYNALALSLYEIAPGILINEGAISSVEITDDLITVDFEGSDHRYKFKPDADATLATEVASHTWKLPTASFTALGTAAAAWRSSMDGTLEGLATSIATETADRIAAITAEEQRVDALIASGMWLYADQASFPPAADNHGRVVHSHADAAIFFAHAGAWHQIAKEVDLQTTIASLASEASTRETADTTLQANIDAEAATRAADDTTEANTRSGADAALSARLDVLEADPTTATAVAAVQTDVDQNEADSDAADAALSARLDVLEADPTTATAVAAVQSDVDQNEADADAAIAGEATTRANADTALSGRLDVLEADPTTATAVAAVQTDVDANEVTMLAADAALSGRLDVLEADPTTATAVAAKLDASAVSAYGLTLVDDADAATARTTLGLGTAATTAATDYATAAQGALADTAVQPAALSSYSLLDGTNIPGPYADDTAAAAGGVAVGALYKHNNGQIHYRVS